MSWLLRKQTLTLKNMRPQSSTKKVSIDKQYFNKKHVNSSISIDSEELLTETTQLKKQLEEEKKLKKQLEEEKELLLAQVR